MEEKLPLGLRYSWQASKAKALFTIASVGISALL
jgi:hypothetical protein